MPFDTWWETMERGAYPGLDGLFVHPVLDERVMAGNGVIGLELAERLDGIDTVLVPWGGGGLTCGIASALAAVSPATRVIACEPATGAPLTASLAADEPPRSRTPPRSWTARARRPSCLPCGSGRAPSSRARSRSRSPTSPRPSASWRREGTSSRRARARSPLAAALGGHAGDGRVVCIVSGGNIDTDRLTAILSGDVPS